jgi:hypothetical protein
VWRYLLTTLLLCASLAQAQVQIGDGRSVDLVYATADLKFTVIDMGGKTQDLQVKETVDPSPDQPETEAHCPSSHSSARFPGG